MEMQNIQTGTALYQELFKTAQKSAGLTNPANRPTTSGEYLRLQAAAFHLEIQLYAENEYTSQGEALPGFSLDLISLSLDFSAGQSAEALPAPMESDSPLASLLSEDGYWGVNQTAARIADFVIHGAGEDGEKLKAGRAGIIQGLKEAERTWGGTLPDISYATMQKALEQVDSRLSELGLPAIDIAV